MWPSAPVKPRADVEAICRRQTHVGPTLISATDASQDKQGGGGFTLFPGRLALRAAVPDVRRDQGVSGVFTRPDAEQSPFAHEGGGGCCGGCQSGHRGSI